MNVRRATPDDTETLIDLRMAFVCEFGDADDPEHRVGLRDYLPRALRTESFVAWIAEDDRRDVATAGLVVYERMVRSGGAGVGLEGYVLNVYTRPDARKNGYGEALMREMLAYARGRDIRLTLIATEDGRRLYERLGFWRSDNGYRWKPE